MRDIILSIPEQLKRGCELGSMRQIAKSYRRIVSCGMGSSAIAGEMLSMARENIPDLTDVIVHWDYDLPIGTTASDLIICTSWSGQTEETLSSYRAARMRGCPTLAITTGGTLAELASDDDSPLVVLPTTLLSGRTNLQPRMAEGFMVGALFGSLGLGENLPTGLDPASMETAGKELAGRLGPRIPVIYTSYPWRRLTGLWKTVYSETTKRQVIVNWFPSAAHNEIVGWDGPYKNIVAFVLLRDTDEAPRYSANFDAILALLPAKGYDIRTVQLSGSTVLEKAFNSYLLALWTSFYAAQEFGVDNQSTELLDRFKELKTGK